MSHEAPHSHVEVVDKARAEDMITAAGHIGDVAVKIVAATGEPYPLHGGGELTVPENSYAVKVSDKGTAPDGMQRFHQEASSITEHRIAEAQRAVEEAHSQAA